MNTTTAPPRTPIDDGLASRLLEQRIIVLGAELDQAAGLCAVGGLAAPGGTRQPARPTGSGGIGVRPPGQQHCGMS